MKKRNNVFIFIFLLLTIFFIKSNVLAAQCSDDELKVYREEAKNLNVTYDLIKKIDDIGASPDDYYYDLIILNMTDNIKIKFGQFYFTSEDVKDDELILKHVLYLGGYKVDIKVYTNSNTKCNDTLLRTININIPYWNRYSEREECNNHKNLPICKSNSNVEEIVDDDAFIRELDREIKEEQENSAIRKEKNDNIFDLYWKNRKITIPVTIVIIGLIIAIYLLIYIKNRKKVKIDLGDKL